MHSRALCLFGLLGVITGATRPLQAEGSASSSPPGQIAAPAPRQWVYALTTRGGSAPSAAPVTLVVVETGRRRVAGRQVVDFAAEVNGRRITQDELSEANRGPFTLLGVYWSLLFGRDKRGRRVDLTQRSQPLDAASFVKDPEHVAATWRPDARGLPRSALGPDDEAFSYRTKIGAWQSLCMAFEHPSPETGDSFTWTRCFAPGVGVTLLAFESVWGDFRCELTRPPARPALP